MIGLDLNETQNVTVAGATWQVGAVPWGKLEALRIAMAEAADVREVARKRLVDLGKDAEDSDKVAALREFQRANVPYLEACAEIVRWGVRSTPVEKLNAVPLERESFAGLDCPVLARPVVEALKRVAGKSDDPDHVAPRLVDTLALHVLTANDVSADDLLGFK